MKKTTKNTLKGALFVLAAAAALLLSANSHAQDAQTYPGRTVRFIVPVPADGGVDTLARIVAEVLRSKWGQPVVVENRAGAGGNIGAEAVFRAEPDGHTLLFTAGGVLVTNKMLYAKLGFDPEAFVPVSLVAANYSVLVVNPRKVAAESVQQLITFAKANPDRLDYASPGSGTGSHLTAELFKSAAGVKITHIPYKGTSPALNDIVSGQVGVMFAELGSVLPHIRAGTVRALAVTSEKRISSLPDVPALSEVLPGFLATPWNGIVAPPKTPPALASRISSAIADEIRQPDVVKRLNDRYFDVIGSTPDDMAHFMKQEVERWGTVIRTIESQGGLSIAE
jgi:tripartite-type tricarboxylate transporter receptor subunit TctC